VIYLLIGCVTRKDTRHIPSGGCEPGSISQDHWPDHLLHEVTQCSKGAARKSSSVVRLQLGTFQNARYGCVELCQLCCVVQVVYWVVLMKLLCSVCRVMASKDWWIWYKTRMFNTHIPAAFTSCLMQWVSDVSLHVVHNATWWNWRKNVIFDQRCFAVEPSCVVNSVASYRDHKFIHAKHKVQKINK